MSIFVPKDRRSLFRQFLGGMYDAVVITDPNGHILDINARATEHFGYELDDVLDQPVSLLIPGLQAEVVLRIRKGLEGDRHVMINANGRNRAGEKFACEVTVSVIDLMNPGDLVFTVRNIEKRRELMTAYRSKVNAFNVAPSALFVCDADGCLCETNEAFRGLFGLANEASARTHALADFVTDGALEGLFRKALRGERVVARAGSFEVTMAPNAAGRKTIGVVGSVARAEG